MARKFWGIPRGKRSLRVSIDVLKAIEPVMIGRVMSKELQKEIDEFLVGEGLKRERKKIHPNPGSLRGNLTNFKAFGLIYLDFDSRVHLTKVGEELIDDSTPEAIWLDLLRKQILNFQYPCPYAQKGNSKIISDYKIKPYRFILELLLTDELNYITLDEAARFLVFAENHNQKNVIKNSILNYRDSDEKAVLEAYFNRFDSRGIELHRGNLISEHVDEIADITGISEDEVSDILMQEVKVEETYRPNSRWTATYGSRVDVVSTMKTHLTEADLIDSAADDFRLTKNLEAEVKDLFTNDKEHFPEELIPFPGYSSSLNKDEKTRLKLKFLNTYGRGWSTDEGIQRTALEGEVSSPQKIRGRIIEDLYDEAVRVHALSKKEAVDFIKDRTQYPKTEINNIVKNNKSLSLDDFKNHFIEVGCDGSRNLEFEKMCRTVFDKLGFEADHVGQQGRMPDVIAVYSENRAGLIDAKATSGSYSVTSSDERAMRDYIDKFKKEDEVNVDFFLFAAGTTANTSDTNIKNIYQDTGVRGSIISTAVLMDLLDYQMNDIRSCSQLAELFKLNKEILNSSLMKSWD